MTTFVLVLVLVVVLVLENCLSAPCVSLSHEGIPAVPGEEAESNPMVGKRLLGRTFVEDEDDDEYEYDETGVA